MMLPPRPEHNTPGVLDPFIKQPHHTIAEPSDKDVPIRFVRRESGEVGSSLSGNILLGVRSPSFYLAWSLHVCGPGLLTRK
jgi:hypothetical protein